MVVEDSLHERVITFFLVRSLEHVGLRGSHLDMD